MYVIMIKSKVIGFANKNICYTYKPPFGGNIYLEDLMKRLFVFAVLTILVIGSLAAQSAAADAQRIVGTWTIIDDNAAPSGAIWNNGTVWVFNANGTGTRGGTPFNFGFSLNGNIGIGDGSWPVFISPNGSRMIFRGAVFQKN